MHYHSNHMYCTQSNWNGEHYDSRHFVSIEKYIRNNSDRKLVIDEDWLRLIDEVDIVNEERISSYYQRGEVVNPTHFLEPCAMLKPEVQQWMANIQPPKSAAERKLDQWGWAIGDQTYRMRNSMQFSLWFYRRSDAMSFIREWSQYKKPTSYFNYFSGHHWNLDTTTGKRIVE